MISRLASLQKRSPFHKNPIFEEADSIFSDSTLEERKELFNEDRNNGDEDLPPELEAELFGSLAEDLDKVYKKATATEQPDIEKPEIRKKVSDHHIKWRQGPAPFGENTSNELKLTSLAAFHNDIGSSSEHAHNESTISLLNYFAFLGTTSDYENIDYEFIENIIPLADINVKDIHGQTLFHEVARDWGVELGSFMKEVGAKYDEPDNYGRTPLFVAVSANNTEMVNWLIENRANVHHKTIEDEGQYALHYAAKYGSVQPFHLLLNQGVSPVLKDSKGRTPFFVAAYNGQIELCKIMLDMELPTACYANNGVATIDLIIRNLPSCLADRALSQFVTTNPTNRTQCFYISCMEKGRWVRLNNKLPTSFLCEKAPSTIHEILVETEDLKLISHPITEKLLSLKYNHYGRKYININIALTLLYTFLWTVVTIAASHGGKNRDVLLSKETAGICSGLTFLLTLYFLYQLFLYYKVGRKTLLKRRNFVEDEIAKEQKTCHPQWKFEKILLDKKLELVDSLENRFWKDRWNIVELLCLIMGIGESILVFSAIALESSTVVQKVSDYYTAFFIIVVWLRLNRCLRSISLFGPFIAMLGQCAIATAQFGFLYFEFYIPFSAAIWVTFGGIRTGFDDSNYETISDMFYEVYLMSIIGDYDTDTLLSEDRIVAHIYLFIIILILGIVALNLYIALLSERVARINEKSIAITQLMKAKELLFYEKSNPLLMLNFEEYIHHHCAPLVAQWQDKNRYSFNYMLRRLRKNNAFLTKGLKDYFDEIGNSKTLLEHTKKKIVNFQQMYSVKTKGKMKHGVEGFVKTHGRGAKTHGRGV